MNSRLLPSALNELDQDELLVNEFFHSIQGEAKDAGRPCFFIRLAGCHLRCHWCDTEYAFYDGKKCSVEECIKRAQASRCNLVEVTGGEPLLQSAVYTLLERLCDAGHEVLLETSGARPIDRVDRRVRRIVDWKTPGSGMESHNHKAIVGNLRQGDELKLVIRDRPDYEWARNWVETQRDRLSTEIPIWFAPVHGELQPVELAGWILEDRLSVRLGLQIHKYVWSPDARGV